MQIDHTCDRPGCDCKVQHMGDFCSEACRRNAEDTELDHCTCGHVDCGTSTPETRGVPEQASHSG